MPFTALEIENINNQALDFYIKNEILSQTIQDKPLLSAMRAKQKTFPGGRGEIKGNVKSDYDTTFVGYSHDDTVSYGNPANVKQFSFPWKEQHAGISMTFTELKKNGMSISNSTSGSETSNHSEREVTALTDIIKDKFEDMDEGMSRSMNLKMWQDGSQDPKDFPGVQYFIADDPTTGVVGGIDAGVNTWWRNRALVAGNKITPSASLQTLTKTLRREVRQLRRYDGRPSLLLCGSAFLEALELEVHEKGTYTQTGFVNNGKIDLGSPDIAMKGVGNFQYDPTLDDLGRSKFCYFIDPRHLYPYVMDGEDMVQHSPARPAEKYVFYKAVTWTGAMITRKRNAHGVYEVA